MKKIALLLVCLIGISAHASEDFMCLAKYETAPFHIIMTSKKTKEDRKGRDMDFIIYLNLEGTLVPSPRDGWLDVTTADDGGKYYDFGFGHNRHGFSLTFNLEKDYGMNLPVRATLKDNYVKEHYSYYCYKK